MGSIFGDNKDPDAVKFEDDYRQFQRLQDKYYEGKVSIEEIKQTEYYKTARRILNFLSEKAVLEEFITANFDRYIVFDEKKISPNIYTETTA